MIVRIKGKLLEQGVSSLFLEVQGLVYEVLVPVAVLSQASEQASPTGELQLVTYHYYQLEPSRAVPVMIGFFNDLEKDFFLQFITVSGIGPRAAVRALNKPIAEITRAIEAGDTGFLKTLPGIGAQRAKEIVAKLQGKIGRFGLIPERTMENKKILTEPDWQQEALAVLMQLQYKRPEAQEMIHKALERSTTIQSTEELLNEIYKQKVKN